MKLGIVLAGGGGKGAYQIGVLKALHQLGLTQYIKGISGTSVGALNGALLLNGNIEQACLAWETIAPSKILSIKGQPLIDKLKGTGFQQLENVMASYSEKLEDYGVFSRSGMEKLITEYVDLPKISASTIPFYATCVQFPTMKKTRFQLNGLAPERIQTILLATSAIPVVFPPETIDGALYLDGGLVDNVPIEPLYEQGCDVIIVVPLNRSYVLDRSLYPNAKIYEIVPQKGLGHLVSGTMQFNQEIAKQRIQDGYDDAMQLLQPTMNMQDSEASMYTAMDKMAHSEQAFQRVHQQQSRRFNDGLADLQRKIQGARRT